ncbi:acyl-CoA thioesterase [Psychroserpens sp. XS_ASV72]|uniref:acyl-CoA thioesterase n=1 Tax=Psychroserpens sp. XS_ASV72 TaxID=3241293 RepID=UPI00351483FD
MKVYEKTITVTESDLDSRNHVNNVRYVQWVQDIAEADWTSNTSEDLRSLFFWVMISHHIQYKSEAVLGDVLLLKTYVKTSEGVKSIRMVDIYNKDTGKLLTTSETIWCLISHETKRPARITQEIISVFS